DGIRDATVTGVQTCALPICHASTIRGLTSTRTTFTSMAGLLWEMLNFFPLSPVLGGEGLGERGLVASAKRQALDAPPAEDSRLRSEERRVGKGGRAGWARY